ncbi:MAG: T9SS type A sorting domain-containing protein [Bacteroidales bacterium]|nr:T9SS type A sorting domain-containing protein [Candidatus Latescibacterota bacterium]
MKAARLLPVISIICTYSVLTLALALPVILSPVQADAAWLPDGSLVYVGPGGGESPHIVTDGAGGSFVVWEDDRNSFTTIYAQRVDGSGTLYWTTDGIPVSEDGQYNLLELFSDGEGGAIIVCTLSGEIWAQRFDSGGNILWGSLGVEVTGGIGPYSIVAAPDGLGGFVTAFRTGGYIYAQRVDSEGNLSWDEVSGHGAIVCGDHQNPDIVGDGMGGAFVAYNNDSGYIFVQRVYPSGAVWLGDGVELDGDYRDGTEPVIAGDAFDGVVVAWKYGSGFTDIRAHSIDAGGNYLWSSSVFICQGFGNQLDPEILSDGRGGAYIAWADERDDGISKIYAQHVDKFRFPLWTTNGILVGHDVEHQLDHVLLESGGGCIIAWRDLRWDEGLAGQKLDADGRAIWAAGGLYLGHVPGGSGGGWDFCHDGAGGLFATMRDNQVTLGDGIYAQSFGYKGVIPVPDPAITQVADVPADQGGAVRLTVTSSEYDDLDQRIVPVTRYDVWQRVDGAPSLMAAAFSQDASQTEDLIVESGEERFLLTAPTGAIPAGTWELVGSFDAAQSSEYIFRAVTLADSSSYGIPYNVYIVTAHTIDPFVWYVSEPDSGYSVDNLAPAPPLGLAGEQSQSPAGIQLSWDQNTENDFWYYAVYRSTSEIFTPGAGNLVATPETESWFDGSWDWQQDYWYKLSAIDENGNESGYITLVPGEITGDDPPAPRASYLSQNYPNPFNPSTTIKFGLTSSSHVTLRVYDTAGRLVRVVVEEFRPAGHYDEKWDGITVDGLKAASGVYFYKLSAGSFVETKKMILLK